MTEVLFIRHPETDLAGTFCGHSDPPINAAGQAQLATLVHALASETFEAVYTSDLQRASALADALAKTHRVPCVITSALREIHFGEWESLTWSQIEQRNPAAAAAWVSNYPDQSAPNGEPFKVFQARVLNELDSIFTGPKERIAIVTHAGVIRTMLTTRCNLDETTAWSLTKPYCSVVRYNHSAAAVTR